MDNSGSADAGVKSKGGAEKGRQKHRSPNYPLFDLGKAVQLTKVLYDADKTHKVPILVAHERWGYTRGGTAGNQAVAAVKSYGLISVEGNGDSRQIAVSDSGRRIVLNAADRPELLKIAATSPPLFASLWSRYHGNGLPSTDVLRHHLIFDRNFNEDFVDNAVDRFISTVAFAQLEAGDTIEGGNSGVEHEIKVGDVVQWTSNGTDQFNPPKKVVGFDESGEWAFFEDGKSGVPVSELTLSNPPQSGEIPPLSSPGGRPSPPNNPFLKPSLPEISDKPGFVTANYPLDEGSATLQLPETLSKDSFRDLEYWITGILNRAKRKAGIDD